MIAQLELADAALHAEQQAIVRPARVVDAVEVDDAGLDQIRTTRADDASRGHCGRAARHRGRAPRRPCPAHRAATRRSKPGRSTVPLADAAEIVVDDFDVGEAAPTCDLDQLVLAPLALQVRLNLLRRRLADIDDRLALQHGCRKESVMRCHRRPPALRLPLASSRRRARDAISTAWRSAGVMPRSRASSRTRSSWRGAAGACGVPRSKLRPSCER